jgi:hypothetical protein
MASSTIRAIVEYNKERLAVLFQPNLGEKDFLCTCLQEFSIDIAQWTNFEIILSKADCKLKTSNHLRNDDEILCLREKNQSQKVSVNSLNFNVIQ